MPNQFKRKISGPSSFRMDRQKNMKRVKALRDSGQLKRDNPLSKLHNSIKGALSSLSRKTDSSATRVKTDSSATRVKQGPKVKQLSPPTAQQAANKLIKTGQGAVKKAKFNQLSPYQKSVQTRNESRANAKRDKLKDSIARAKAKMGPQNTDYKNNYIQSEIDKLKKTLAKIK
tara:strand:+ start:63 stop:581 length:519 start_codon:yes stop_codon:yes gene_type:complete